MNYQVKKDGKVFAPCTGCGQEVELKEFPAGEAACENPNCKSTFPYSVPPGIGPEKLQSNSAKLKNNTAKKRPQYFWMKEDDDLLFAAINRGGMKEAKKVLGHKFCLASIYNRAHLLNIEFKNANSKWSAQELKVLHKLYPKSGSQLVFKALDGKYSQRSIRWKACKIGLLMRNRNFWTEEEDDLLRKTYSQGGVRSAFKVLGKRHNKGGIQTRAHRLGIRSNSNKRISELPDSKTDFSIRVKPGQKIVLRIEIIPEIV